MLSVSIHNGDSYLPMILVGSPFLLTSSLKHHTPSAKSNTTTIPTGKLIGDSFANSYIRICRSYDPYQPPPANIGLGLNGKPKLFDYPTK